MLSSALVQRRGYEGGGYDTVGVEGRAQGTSRSGDRDKRGPTEGGRMALCAAMSHVLGSSLLPTLDVRRFGAYCVRVSDVAQDAWWQHTSHQLTPRLMWSWTCSCSRAPEQRDLAKARENEMSNDSASFG